MNTPAFGQAIKRAATRGGLLVLCLSLVLVAIYTPAKAAPPDPIRRFRLFDTGVTGAASIATSSLTTKSTLTSGAYRVTVALSGTNSVFNLQATSGSTTVTTAFNGGTALTAGNVYTFTVGVDGAYTYNFTATTTTRVAYMIVDEVTSDGL